MPGASATVPHDYFDLKSRSTSIGEQMPNHVSEAVHEPRMSARRTTRDRSESSSATGTVTWTVRAQLGYCRMASNGTTGLFTSQQAEQQLTELLGKD
jgi:hypothetical protein